jgi:hypothetical protein
MINIRRAMPLRHPDTGGLPVIRRLAPIQHRPAKNQDDQGF